MNLGRSQMPKVGTADISNWNNDFNQYLIDITNLLEADM